LCCAFSDKNRKKSGEFVEEEFKILLFAREFSGEEEASKDEEDEEDIPSFCFDFVPEGGEALIGRSPNIPLSSWKGYEWREEGGQVVSW